MKGDFLRLVDKKKIPNGDGYMFVSEDELPVLASDTKLEDLVEGKKKWKIGVSLSSGCKVGCAYCFVNNMPNYRKLTSEEIVGQVDFIYNNSGNKMLKYDQTKIEMKEMGDPSLNPYNVCDAIREIEKKYNHLTYVVSTAGIKNSRLFNELKKVREEGADIRLQFSCHTTSDKDKKRLSPRLNMLKLEEISNIIEEWYDGNSKVTLTFVPFEDHELSADKLKELFDPEKVFIKISYIDKTPACVNAGLENMSSEKVKKFILGLENHGFTYAYRNGFNI